MAAEPAGGAALARIHGREFAAPETAARTPTQAQFIDAAIEVSRLLRIARVEAPDRPLVLGALVLATSEAAGALDAPTLAGLNGLNGLVRAAIRRVEGLSPAHVEDLLDALHLAPAKYPRLETELSRLLTVLDGLQVRALMHSGIDFLGTFYEAFLRYGYDNNALGIVFTPRHITRLCVELGGVVHTDRVIDIACGSGGFLVAAFDAMIDSSPDSAARAQVGDRLRGFDPNPTVWALALLNLHARGTGRAQIERASSLTEASRLSVAGTFTHAFLNPPFAQSDEPERHFVDAAAAALEPGGLLVAVVKAGLFADDDHRAWRASFTSAHRVLGIVSLPDDVFYPTAAPASILLARAHQPQRADDLVYLARVSNDGYEKRKGKRVERAGSELAAIAAGFAAVQAGTCVADTRSVSIPASKLVAGAEWSPQQWLPQPPAAAEDVARARDTLAGSILRTAATYPEVAASVLADFGASWRALPALPYGREPRPVQELFTVVNGRSSGERNHLDGDVAYISSGDQANSVTRLVTPVRGEVFESGGITVTAFGQAYLQPWPFMARGNGGSSVRVLVPNYAMSVRELLWFAAQVNIQRWRFFYARMAIKSRISRLLLDVPAHPLPDGDTTIATTVAAFLASFHAQRTQLSGPT